MSDFVTEATPPPASSIMPAETPRPTANSPERAAPALPAQPPPTTFYQSRRRLFQNATALVAATALATVTTSENATAQTVPAAPAMRPFPTPLTHQARSTAVAELTPLAVIALNRMGFGPRPGDIEAFNALGNSPAAALNAYVEQQLNPAGIDDSACDAMIAGYQFQSLGKSLAQLWIDYHKTPKVDRSIPVAETRKATLLKAIYSKRQLQEVLADFWHNHFNVHGWDYWSQPVWVHYDRDVIRANMLGNFRQMLEAVAQSPAMLYYLDNQSNSGGNPNENYARELFELHTMGAENYLGVAPLIVKPDGSFDHPGPKDANGRPLLYCDEDVYGATTCFTGWRINESTGLFSYDSNAHFPYQKLVLGQAIPASQGIQDGKTVLDLLARHKGTAHFICRKLCRRLIGDDPPESVVQAAAAVFTANVNAPDQLKRVVQTILLSPEFSSTWGAKSKRPFEYVVSLLRAAEADFAPDDGFFWITGAMGQPLFGWRPPNGYPDVRQAWDSTMPMVQRWRVCNWLLNGWTYGGTGDNKNQLRVRFTAPPAIKTPTALVDYWTQRLLGYPLPAKERQPIIDFMAYGRNPDYDLPDNQLADRLPFMIGLIFMAPSFLLR